MPSRGHSRWKILAACLAVALVAGGVQSYVQRYAMYPDGVCYLDLADAWRNGQWAQALNRYWSPCYAWILAGALWAVEPTPFGEAPLLHGVNFIIYSLAAAAFVFLVLELLRFRREEQIPRWAAEHCVGMPEGALIMVVCGVFVWQSLGAITLTMPTPDMLVSAVVYLAGALVVRLRGAQRGGVATAALLGLVLGVGYLAKAALFPLAFVFIGTAGCAVGTLRRGWACGLVALAVFLAVALPFVAAISEAGGRLTIGESGRLNYGWNINGVAKMVHWTGDTRGHGRAQHPERLLIEAPRVFEFGSPVGGTYPPLMDPTYWYAGFTPRFEWTGQCAALLHSGYTLFRVLIVEPMALWAVGLVVILAAGATRSLLRSVAAEWWLLLPPALALALYALVLMVPRYVAPFIVVLLTGLLAAIHVPDTPDQRRLAARAGGVMTAVLVLLIWQVLPGTGGDIGKFWGRLSGLRAGSQAERLDVAPLLTRLGVVGDWMRMGNVDARLARALNGLGVGRGDAVGTIGDEMDIYWARLAGCRIVAELPRQDAGMLWQADADTQRRVVEAFRTAGARAIVTRVAPLNIGGLTWRPIENTGYAVCLLEARPPKGDSLGRRDAPP